ncbi:ricin B lectin domain-containing protein [Aspergillus sergii]|uniref:Ricin B lectin domain-containing protein n=1 Tax=Aspergillus sergii TaxID=1034303 RepID=A0A5N6X1M3_9EURO|nr:ricin B lectin domain-containing protein [Aspergillus sergii]
MSDLEPGAYIIVPRHVSNKRLDVDDVTDPDNVELQLYEPLTDREKADQVFVFAKCTESQYFIISIKNGTYLTATDDGKPITATVSSPMNKRIRWRIHPVGDGSGAFYISSVAFPGKVIDVAGGATDNHADIIIYDHKDDGSENQQFFLTHPNNA